MTPSLSPRTPRWLLPSLLVLVLAAPAVARAETPDPDPRAVRIADQVMQALGGKERWDALTGLRWTFEVTIDDTVRSSRRHAWDKHAGLQRVEGRTRGGDPFVFACALDGSVAHAWMKGQAIEGDSLQKLAKRSHSLWTNDSYWFLMPYKLRDPGVHLRYDGDTTIAGVHFDRLAMSFEKVGETPGDRYWVYVDRANHRIERWDMVLQNDQPPAKTWTWEGWEQHDGLWFPTAHRQGTTVVATKAVETVKAFPAGTFDTP